MSPLFFIPIHIIRRTLRVCLAAALLASLEPRLLAAQTDAADQDQTASLQTRAASAVTPNDSPTHGPPPPEAPDVVSRDDAGHATLRAFRTPEPIRIDGRLDEEIYSRIRGADGLIQQEPKEGTPISEKTELWVLFDDRNLYVTFRCFDEHPERWVVNELQRDGNVSENESVTILLDTFHDHRNGFMFQSSPLSVLRDQAFTDEGNLNESWNTVWDVKSSRFEGGYGVEFSIPFKSLRYRGSGPQVWSVNFRRIIRYKNELALLTRIPASYGQGGQFRMSLAADLVGLETPAQSSNIEVKPYVISSVATDLTTATPFRNDATADVGFDFKYGVTRSLTADLTYNTDFAQVEEDVQQVNLTRFNIQFPEKREFFLEGQGIFAFGGVVTGGGRGGPSTGDIPVLFFSRRIGLSQGQPVPVIAGGRLTGKIGRFDVGALNIQTDDKAAAGAVSTNFGALRLKRDVLRRSNIGIIATRRTPNANDAGANASVGADANFSFFNTITINSFYARTDSPNRAGDESSYRGRFDYNSDRYGAQAEHVMVGDAFNPEMGFTRRTDFRRSTGQLRFSPRPSGSRLIRKLNWQANFDYITNADAAVLENTRARGLFRIDFSNSDQWQIDVTRDHEHLPEDFTISRGVVLPTGGYNWNTLGTSYNFGPQRRVYGNLSASYGTFYNGHKKELNFGGSRITISPRFSFEPGLALNWVDLPEGSFDSRLITNRLNVTPSARMVISGLVQYNPDANTLSSSARLRWEYIPGSELFVVWTDGRDMTGGNAELRNRSFAVKVTRLLRF